MKYAAIYPHLGVGLYSTRPGEEQFREEWRRSGKQLFALYAARRETEPSAVISEWFTTTPLGGVARCKVREPNWPVVESRLDRLGGFCRPTAVWL